jgi:hypothetical protein
MKSTKKRFSVFIFKGILFCLGFLFIVISGCRSRTVENNDAGNDTIQQQDVDLMIAPEYGGPPNDWEEMIEDEYPSEDTL